MDYKLVQYLTKKRIHIFTTDQARLFAKDIGVDSNAILDRLYRLNKKGVIERLKNGLYCLAPELLSGIPIHEYEIGIALAQPSSIAYLSAYSFHNLTDQISSIIYVSSIHEPSKTYSKNMFSIRGVRYKIIRLQEKHFFGFEKKWISQVLIPITDLERTLIDGLVKPKYCGGFREVLYAYSIAIDRLDLDKIISYALLINDSVCRRLGWVLSYLKVNDARLLPLMKSTSSSFAKLDPSGPEKGPWNKKWLLRENI